MKVNYQGLENLGTLESVQLGQFLNSLADNFQTVRDVMIDASSLLTTRNYTMILQQESHSGEVVGLRIGGDPHSAYHSELVWVNEDQEIVAITRTPNPDARFSVYVTKDRRSVFCNTIHRIFHSAALEHTVKTAVVFTNKIELNDK